MDVTPPPLGVKLTGYRVIFITIVSFFGTVKTILSYKGGQSIAPTILDWVSAPPPAVVSSYYDSYSLEHIHRGQSMAAHTTVRICALDNVVDAVGLQCNLWTCLQTTNAFCVRLGA